MLDFKPPQISDAGPVRKILRNSERLGSEACFGNLFMWCNAYNCTIALEDETLVCRANGSYTVPVGKNADSMLLELIEENKKTGQPLKLHAISEEMKKELEERFGSEIKFTEDRDSSDYIYSVEALATLSGKKYHGKRNHITYFENTFDWSYEDMNPNTTAECLEFSKYWMKTNAEKLESGTDKEMFAIEKALQNFEALGLVGGILRVEGDIVAYTFGESINDSVFCTHVEKAISDLRGAYPMINREFARNTVSSYTLVNREEDMGIEGLRSAKESYHPEILLLKYTAEV